MNVLGNCSGGFTPSSIINVPDVVTFGPPPSNPGMSGCTVVFPRNMGSPSRRPRGPLSTRFGKPGKTISSWPRSGRVPSVRAMRTELQGSPSNVMIGSPRVSATFYGPYSCERSNRPTKLPMLVGRFLTFAITLYSLPHTIGSPVLPSSTRKTPDCCTSSTSSLSMPIGKWLSMSKLSEPARV